jgi:hypothetical protein
VNAAAFRNKRNIFASALKFHCIALSLTLASTSPSITGDAETLSLLTPARRRRHPPRRTIMQAKRRETLTGRLVPIVLALAMAQTAAAQPSGSMAHASHSASDGNTISQSLSGKVRDATRRFLDVNVAMHEGWIPATPCVSGPDAGAMGVHFVLPGRLADGVLNPDEPEALIYEPMANGALRLVGVEFIVFAGDWAGLHPDGSTPAVDGHLTNFVPEPNRFGLHAFYELHVWAWEHNPSGTFADWNTNVSCDNQPGQ